MERLIMIVAPGEDVDRKWVPVGGGSGWYWMPRPSPMTWSFNDLVPLMDGLEVQPLQALPQRWSVPGWSIDLWFYVDSRLIVRGGVKLPSGYVLAGHVMNGPPLEMSDLCVICFRRPTEYSRTGAACCEDHADA